MKNQLFLFSDACPTDWLEDGQDGRWHTAVHALFSPSEDVSQQLLRGQTHEELLPRDQKYSRMIQELADGLPRRAFRAWKKAERSYRVAFCRSFIRACKRELFAVNVTSFQEGVLRSSQRAVLKAFNGLLGGPEGRGIGFSEQVDAKGRRLLTHEYVDFDGFHRLQAPDNQMLVLLLLAWWVMDQYHFYRRREWAAVPQLELIVVSDILSGDHQAVENSRAHQIIRRLLTAPFDGPARVVTRSKAKDQCAGDLIVDNLAGWLNEAITDSQNEFGQLARDAMSVGIFDGWNVLLPSDAELLAEKAEVRLFSSATPPARS
jgi:hypothetical protein